mgnify:CR=1 FL=1
MIHHLLQSPYPLTLQSHHSNLQLCASVKVWVVRVLSSKLPRLERLSITAYDCPTIEIAKLLCERDENGNQRFPYLHSFHHCGHDSGNAVAYLLDNREGIENFKELNLGGVTTLESVSSQEYDVRSRMWQKCAFPPPPPILSFRLSCFG